MKKHIIKNLFAGIALFVFLFSGCKEKEFSEDYDIKFPISEIIDFNPKTEFIDQNVTAYGENLDIVTSVSIGTATCEIISKESTKLVFKVSRAAETAPIVVTNKYNRTNISKESFVAKYIDVVVTGWPTQIEATKSFNIIGQNMDMISTAKFDNHIIKKSASSPTMASFLAADLVIGSSGKLVITTKSGQTIESPVINIIAPKLTYDPKPTLILFDFDTVEPTILGGNATGDGATFTSGKNLNGVSPFFGNCYSVIAPRGNGWNGNYQILATTNNNKGFDLASYQDPHITFLVNTNGKKGYFNPALTIGGTWTDKHFTGQEGEYTDNYMIQTAASWEWRSYSLKKMGFTNAKGLIEKIELLIRGGNIGNGNTDPFELHIDQVMITDGPLNPVLIFDFEVMPPFAGGNATQNQGSGVTTVAQGLKYITVKDSNVSNWNVKGNTKKTANDGSLFAKNETFYVNFLVNTGNGGASGYFQMVFEQANGTKLGYHFKGSDLYEDDYKFANTGGKWEWRSYKLDPKGFENWGSGSKDLNLSSPFDVTVEFTTGKVAGQYETNLDYVILTSVPLDTKK